MGNLTDIRHGYNSKEYICLSLLPLQCFAFCYWKESQMSEKKKLKGKSELVRNYSSYIAQ